MRSCKFLGGDGIAMDDLLSERKTTRVVEIGGILNMNCGKIIISSV